MRTGNFHSTLGAFAPSSVHEVHNQFRILRPGKDQYTLLFVLLPAVNLGSSKFGNFGTNSTTLIINSHIPTLNYYLI